MSAAHRAWAAVILGVLATALLVAADVLAWPLSPLTAGLIGMVAGWPAGYLAPSPRQAEQRARKVIVAPADRPVSTLDVRGPAVPSASGDSTTRRIEGTDE